MNATATKDDTGKVVVRVTNAKGEVKDMSPDAAFKLGCALIRAYLDSTKENEK